MRAGWQAAMRLATANLRNPFILVLPCRCTRDFRTTLPRMSTRRGRWCPVPVGRTHYTVIAGAKVAYSRRGRHNGFRKRNIPVTLMRHGDVVLDRLAQTGMVVRTAPPLLARPARSPGERDRSGGDLAGRASRGG